MNKIRFARIINTINQPTKAYYDQTTKNNRKRRYSKI